MGKSDEAKDVKKAEKKAKKRAKKEEKDAKKEAKRLKKEQKRLEKEARKNKILGKKQQQQQENEPHGESSWRRHSEKKSSIALNKTSSSSSGVFSTKRIEVSLSLLPAAMKNIMVGLEDSIRTMSLKYASSVGGVLLEFENIRITSNNGHGKVLNELPHLHYKVGFDGLIFCPEVGCKLQGAVTESFPSHLGILVLGYFNTMIPAACLTKVGFVFDEDLQEWSKEDGSSVFAKDDNVDFVVEKIHEAGTGTISIEGTEPHLSASVNEEFADKTALVKRMCQHTESV